MEFEWDDDKAAANEAKHGVPFDYARSVFLDNRMTRADASRAEDGESRTKAIGRIRNKLYTVIFVMRGDICRIISARRANKPEERIYGNRSI